MRKFLYISPKGSNWLVHWEGETTGQTFTRKEDAIKEARKMVKELPEGEVSSIRVQKADGTWQMEWTYGKDPFPPAG